VRTDDPLLDRCCHCEEHGAEIHRQLLQRTRGQGMGEKRSAAGPSPEDNDANDPPPEKAVGALGFSDPLLDR